jgi:phosphoglycolate phosphatase-like HAD superfamily hydrolase
MINQRLGTNMTIILRFSILLFGSLYLGLAHADPLPGWNDGLVKQSIIQFVQKVTDKTSPDYVPPSQRIAAFDNDGTLWVEQPMYTQFIFAFSQVKTLAATYPEWKTEKPFSLILSGDKQGLSTLSMQDIGKILSVTHTGITVEEFQKMASEWLAQAKDPRFNHLYTDLIYQPMLEAMNYLRANDFKIYIVTGGGQDFVRAFALKTYGVQPEQVIGTSGKTQYSDTNNKPELMKVAEVFLVDDKAGKPEAINLFIGQKPIIAFGNSDGDRQMLEWTQSNSHAHLMLLVHHDDAKREFAYGAESKVGTFSDSLMGEAQQDKWLVISMLHDWKVIFPFEIKNP